ncbi:1-acyl-sn-glycerol-3-phosphate acyltransferase alpha-like [Melitaea cinxia]|uniref:1-acyl-sn-glycerol-3-phosphate acyltransferase alpha-like n=1 Tax=Melitaea cinxia TaxID=113334 RepID=UPI001E26EBD7|nr:1-acyl-sn-glycerol-3-phosphate acyltransferase alpha-like [Melitaea cinxia]
MFLLKNKIYKVLIFAKYCFKFGLIYFFLTFCSFIFLPRLIFNGKNIKNGLIVSEPCKKLTKLLGITWQIRNEEIVSENRGAVILINHQSALDALCVVQLWHTWKDAALVVKKEIFYFWPFGLIIYLSDSIFVDRKNPKAANQLLMKKSKKLFHNKIKLVIFPEGTRNSDVTKLLPFKKGAFNIAVGAQVPIIPIVVSPYYFINKQKHVFNKGHVIAQCLEPVSTEGLTMDDVPDLLNRVQNTMEKVYNELLDEVTKDLPPDYPLAITKC